eukprot:403376971
MLDNSQQNQYSTTQLQQQARDTTTFGNQTDHQILNNLMMFNDMRQTQDSKVNLGFNRNIPIELGYQNTDDLIESQRSNKLQQTQNSLESYDPNSYLQNMNLRFNNNHSRIISYDPFSPHPLNLHNLNENDDYLMSLGPKQNLSPKLLSTQGDLQLQQTQVENGQLDFNQNSRQQQNNAKNTQSQSNQNNLYTFNQSSVNTLHHDNNLGNNNQNFISIQDFIKESEDRVKRETEQKFQQKIHELEKRSIYLDRSLELIEDMKYKFKNVENQQNDYNELLMKYNNLLYQYNSHNQSQILKDQSSKDLINHSKSNVQSLKTFHLQGSPLKKLNTIQMLQDNSIFLSNNNASMLQQDKKDTIFTHNQSIQDLRQAQLELQNQALRDQNEQLQFEIERIKLEFGNRKKSGSRKTSPKGSALRNNRQKSNAIISGGLTLQQTTTQSHKTLGNMKQLGSGANSRSRERMQNMYKSQENISLVSNRKRPCQSKTILNAKENTTMELVNFQKQTFVELHKKIDKLEKEKKQLQTKLKFAKENQSALLNEQGELVNQGMQLKCCCQELKQIYEDRSFSLEQIADHWKQKTQQLVGKYYKSLQLVREDHLKLRNITLNAVEQLRFFQEKSLGEVLQRQNEVQVYYEKKVKKLELENKKLSKKVVKQRNHAKQ